MNNFNIYLTIISIIIILVFISLMIIDQKKSYDCTNLPFKFISNNGLFVRFHYYFWQLNKLNCLEKYYNDKIEINGKTYSIIAKLPNQEYLEKDTSLIPFIHRDYVLQIEPYRQTETTNIINNTNITGNNNIVNINQNIERNLISQIDDMLALDIDTYDKEALELFKYKFKANEVSSSDANKVINILTKYSPYISLSTSLINLIKAIFF